MCDKDKSFLGCVRADLLESIPKKMHSEKRWSSRVSAQRFLEACKTSTRSENTRMLWSCSVIVVLLGKSCKPWHLSISYQRHTDILILSSVKASHSNTFQWTPWGFGVIQTCCWISSTQISKWRSSVCLWVNARSISSLKALCVALSDFSICLLWAGFRNCACSDMKFWTSKAVSSRFCRAPERFFSRSLKIKKKVFKWLWIKCQYDLHCINLLFLSCQ